MRKIAITLPEFFEGEKDAIVSLLESGEYWRVHIRKPDSSMADFEKLIANIPEKYYPQISVHDHFEVASRYRLGGIHLNSRNPQPPEMWGGVISRSCHSVDELSAMKAGYDYLFLSPIFPSISKPGYRADFNRDELRNVVNERVFALGGVTAERFEEVSAMGFGGVAMLGSVWRAKVSPDKFGLQYITHPVTGKTMVMQVEEVLRGGCRWIQLRHKDADMETLRREALELRALCSRYDATFIVDDHVDLAAEVNADGVHLGKNDMPVSEARHILGLRRVIGATANTYEDVVKAAEAGADYIGLGPYRFTTTKAKLSPVLGVEGYREIISQCKAKKIMLPIVAIGGIEDPDVEAIMATGIDGVAVSGAIRNAHDPEKATSQIINKINISCQNL